MFIFQLILWKLHRCILMIFILYFLLPAIPITHTHTHTHYPNFSFFSFFSSSSFPPPLLPTDYNQCCNMHMEVGSSTGQGQFTSGHTPPKWLSLSSNPLQIAPPWGVWPWESFLVSHWNVCRSCLSLCMSASNYSFFELICAAALSCPEDNIP